MSYPTFSERANRRLANQKASAERTPKNILIVSVTSVLSEKLMAYSLWHEKAGSLWLMACDTGQNNEPPMA